MALVAFVDGASRGNPGPAAAGVVFQKDGKTTKTLSVPLGTATNNIAEYAGLLLAMQQAVLMGAKELHIFTDSELVAKQWSGEYRIKDPILKVMHTLACQLKPGFKKLAITHVPREKNKLADLEANRALDSGGLFE